ncbi:hypothetical protein [Aliikangiella coralliicola]|uniref:Secreted protein n=1 Tax=Aliikangiella coralliicola TaxID=2592383 RepID=A0A545UJB7_9GAMM|nr:hypothetical protein [Aliikangiella coralliicola]TQV89555.1 hypothetical protein FLL46_01335 [Aliikangiella coralliicola]
MISKYLKQFKKATLIALPIIGSVVFSSSAIAGDEEVNCKTTTSEVRVYSGHAQCYAFSGGQIYTVSQFVAPQLSSTARLTELRYVNGSTKWLSCTANVPFSHYDTVSVRECEYTPKANFSAAEYSYGYITINDFSSDRDGSIVKWEFWLNGVKRATSTTSAGIGGNWPVDIGSTVTLKMVVTDDQGHTDSVTKTRYIQGLPPCNLDPQADHCL